MTQNPLQTTLGKELRAARKGAKRTQADLAIQVGCSLPTVRQAELGQGSLQQFVALAAAVNMRIGGAMPPGDSLGQRLAVLRKRKGRSARALAEMAGISAVTLSAIEAGKRVHLPTVLQVAEAMQVKLRLVGNDASESFWSAAAVSSSFHGWTTPSEILDRLYDVVGERFDLDPCSPARRGTKATVKARMRYTAEDDGLALPWRAATVFVNPPYGSQIKRWVAKASEEVESGRAGLVICLVPARSDTKWWHEYIAGKADVWMLRGRLTFGDGKQPAPFASAIVVWKAGELERLSLCQSFPDAWHILPQCEKIKRY